MKTMSTFKPTTPPSSPERVAEIQAWMAREGRSAADRLLVVIQEMGEKVREFQEGIRVIESAFNDKPGS